MQDGEILLPDGTYISLPVKCDLPVEEAAEAPAAATRGADKGFNLLEKARTGTGSTAAAGSDFFHIYRRQRAKEMARLERLEAEGREIEEEQAFHAQREARIRETLAQTARKAEKRRRAKARRRLSALKAEGGAATV